MLRSWLDWAGLGRLVKFRSQLSTSWAKCTQPRAALLCCDPAPPWLPPPQGELMTAGSSFRDEVPRLSPLTLAVLEDR
jgi:hypothetical protein